MVRNKVEYAVPYQTLYGLWKQAFANSKSGADIQRACNEFWREHKFDDDELRAKARFLEQKAMKAPQQISITKFLRKEGTEGFESLNSAAKQDVQIKRKAVEDMRDRSRKKLSRNNPKKRNRDGSNDSDSSTAETAAASKAPKCHAQDTIRLELSQISLKIEALQKLQLSGIGTSQAQDNQLTSLIARKKRLLARLKRLQQIQFASRRFRRKRKVALILSAQSGTARKVGEGAPGRPRLETHANNQSLMDTIIKLVTPDAAAADRRRSEALRTCRTLNDLRKKLLAEGYTVSRSALYLRLLPRNSNTREGKRHVCTVPVKLLRASNDLRKKHPDSHFAAASMKWVKQVGETFGDESVTFLSQDDKSKVALGKAAATKESTTLMHLEYKVRLPDHDWAVGPRHKLTPSVYAGLEFQQNGQLGYSGPTYIAIRSGKHDSSTAKTHGDDMRRLMDLPNFRSLCKRSDGSVKPILIVMVDGGPDENPRFPKTLHEFRRHFLEFDLDAVFVGTYAPGHSAFNPVERRMAPLSKDLAGLILPHDTFGSHLDLSGKTTNIDLEKKNFQNAGEILAEVWNETVIDGKEVFAEYISPPEITGEQPSQDIPVDWIWKHVRQSQYLLQIVKCTDVNCCRPMRTNLLHLLPDRFIPPPVLLKRSPIGPLAVDPLTTSDGCYYGNLHHRLAFRKLDVPSCKFPVIPFDHYCPSVQEELEKRICTICHVYFPSAKSLKSHGSVHKAKANIRLSLGRRVTKISEPEPEVENSEADVVVREVAEGEAVMYVIDNIQDWIAPVFVENDWEDDDEQMTI